MKQLTPQILAAYIGSEANDSSGRVFIINGHTLDLIENFPNSMGPFKILLLPLSSITDEHLNELFTKIGWQNRYIRLQRRRKEIVWMFAEHKSQPDFTGWNAVTAINFLRAHSYDCDNLIADGLAIDKTTLK